MRKNLTWILILLPVLGMSLINVLNWADLPERIPIHWNFQGQPDSWGGKGTLWLLPFLFLIPALLVSALTLSSAAGGEKNRTAVNCLLIGLGVLFVTMHSKVVLASRFTSLHQDFSLVIAGLSVFMIFMGYSLLHSQRNAWLGIRTPWTLASEENWNRTHRLAGHCFVGAGFIMLPFFKYIHPAVFFGVLFSIIVAAIFHSWRLHRRS
jgi:uncharacterized membrane protein